MGLSQIEIYFYLTQLPLTANGSTLNNSVPLISQTVAKTKTSDFTPAIFFTGKLITAAIFLPIRSLGK
jgi:hypothetical protein